ncbi:MAG: response regulator receiver sensor signal transduction histidine kinase [Magnetococcales bacterium]|nr:response regulator receiver sensor signal transduction histidine kinase [Magnetococcales bacterium]
MGIGWQREPFPKGSAVNDLNREKSRSVAIGHSISMKLLKMVFGTYCLATLILTAVQMWREYAREADEIVQTLALYQPLFEKTLANNVWHLDLTQLDVTLESLSMLPEIVGVSVHDAQNHYIARRGRIDIGEKNLPPLAIAKLQGASSQFKANLFKHRFDLVSTPEMGTSEKLGQVTFYSDATIAFARVHNLFWSILFFAAVKTLFLWGVFLYFGRKLLGRPLLELVAETARFSLDQTGKPLAIAADDTDEIQQLKYSFTLMKTQLQETMEELTQGYSRMNAVASILEIASGSRPIKTLLQQVLAELVNKGWLPIHKTKIQGACIFLFDPERDQLVMEAQVNMPPESRERCQVIDVGMCLCGRAFDRKEAIYSHDLHTHHTPQYHRGSECDTAYYAIPICASSKNRVIGILTCYFQTSMDHDSGDIDFLSGIASSLTNLIERKMAEDALLTHQEYLEQLVSTRTKQLAHAERLACLGTFSAGMAHEINNPNSFISGNVAFLKQFWQLGRPILEQNQHQDPSGRVGSFLNEVDETLDGMLDGSQRISKIVDSLKAYSRGGMETDKVECRLLDPVQDAGYLLRHRIKNGFALIIEVPPAIMVVCDRQQMTQVFVNLLNNAMDAMEGMADSGEKRMTIQAEMLENHVWIRVKDRGPGIPQEAAGKIFDPFYTTKGKTKGTGLGLSIVQGIIQDHGGQITVFSSANRTQETEFLIIFPNREAALAIQQRRKGKKAEEEG